MFRRFMVHPWKCLVRRTTARRKEPLTIPESGRSGQTIPAAGRMGEIMSHRTVFLQIQLRPRSRCLAFFGDHAARDGSQQAAAAFEEADGRGAGPNDLRLDGESAYFRMVKRDDRPLVRNRMVVREADPGEREVSANDRGRFVKEEVPLWIDWD